VLSGQGATPPSAQDFAAEMLGDLVGEGEDARGAHGAKPGRLAAREQMENALP
jgi:hypothetical protein